MRARALTCRATRLVHAQVTLCCLEDGPARLAIFYKPSVGSTNLHHPDILVGAIRGAHLAAYTGQVIDDYLPTGNIPMNCARGTAEHTYGISAMHTCISDHVVSMPYAVADKTRIVLVSRGAGAHTIIATGTSIEVDHHRGRAVDHSRVHQKLERRSVERSA